MLIKIDVEGHEIRTLLGAIKIWKDINIPLIIMEWQWVPNLHKEGKIDNLYVTNFLDTMVARGYTVLAATDGLLLDHNRWMSWPIDVAFVKDDFDF